MSNFYHASHQQYVQNSHPMMPSSNHHGRARRNQRMSSTQPSTRQYRQQQQQQNKHIEKLVVSEPPALTAFRARFEAGRSFDLDDDMEFCPNLLTWDEVCHQRNTIAHLLIFHRGNPSTQEHLIVPHCPADHRTAHHYNITSSLTWLLRLFCQVHLRHTSPLQQTLP